MYVETYDVSSILNWEFIIKMEAVMNNFMMLYGDLITTRYVSPGRNTPGVFEET